MFITASSILVDDKHQGAAHAVARAYGGPSERSWCFDVEVKICPIGSLARRDSEAILSGRVIELHPLALNTAEI